MANGQITYLDGFRLHRGLVAGIRQVLSKQNYLNKINVFPVPDGDTGTNICFTLLSIMDGTAGHVVPHAGKMAEVIADAALDGARGNSGVILAQFFQGFSEAVINEERLSVAQFAKGVRAGHLSAWEALSEPVEGTILSVIDAAADTLTAKTGTGFDDFHLAMQETLEGAIVALEKTPEQLAILKKSGVVDAGAQGFVYILKGVFDFIKSGSLRSRHDDEPELLISTSEAPGGFEMDSEFRFCTECLIIGDNILLPELRKRLAEIGDSIVLGGSKKRAKLHIHTNHPQQVFDIVVNYGVIEGQKVDDMEKQVEVSQSEKGTIAIVTDSTADIPESYLEAHDIHIVPARLSFGNTGYLDKVTITPEEFYTKLVEGPDFPKTSQPTPGDFLRTYQFLASHYESVISIHLPLPVSGTLQSAENAARRLPEANITVVDGKTTAVGLGMVVARAAEAVSAGKSHGDVLALAEQAIDQTIIYAAIKDLSYTVRGGRIKPSRKRIADLLRATPVLTMTPQLTVDMAGKFFGRKDLPGGLAKWVAKRVDLDTTYNIFISHAQCPDDAQKLGDLLPDNGFKVADIQITDTGTALGTHTGPGSLIIALQPAVLA